MFITIKYDYILLWLFLLIPLFLSINLCKSYVIIIYNWKFKLLICAYIIGAIMIYLRQSEKNKSKLYKNLMTTTNYEEFINKTKKQQNLKYLKYMNNDNIRDTESDDDTFIDVYGDIK